MRDTAAAAFTYPKLLRFADFAVEALGTAREEIDALNVYPVPDGDTGTNLFLTLEAARGEMVRRVGVTGGAQPKPDVGSALAAFARGALLGAAGNSGVILSQLLGALTKRLADARPEERAAAVVAEGLSLATTAAYAAVEVPVEGTILSVARAASTAAVLHAGDPERGLGDVLRAAAAAAREALARTPDQLQVLRDAGVVDAGGRGLCVLLDAAETAVTGRRPVRYTPPLGTRAIPVPVPVGDLTSDGPSYEVMYLLDAPEEHIPPLRERLAGLGDSLVVVGSDGLYNVHVHVDDVGAAVEAGIEAGRPHRVRVTHFAEQTPTGGRARTSAAHRTGRGVLLVAAGAGLADLFATAGAAVITTANGRRPSTGDFLEAITATGAAEVIVLPNDRDSVSAARAAGRLAGDEHEVRVAVIPTTAQVQGLSALAVHEPGRQFDEDVLAMTSAARHTRSGAVTVAARQAMTMAGPCEPGDILGVIEGDFAVIGADLPDVACSILDRLLGGGGELVTLVAGHEGTGLVGHCSEHLAARYPEVDVVVYDGGQERYPLLVAVE